MSEIKVNKISPSTGTELTLGDTSDDFLLPSGAEIKAKSGSTITIESGATLANAGTATGFGGGKLKQIVQSELTTTATTSSSTFVALTGVTVSITPTATTSKILVMLTGMMGTTISNQGHLQLFRDTTQVHMGTSVSSRTADSFGYRDFVGSANGTIPVSIMYLDPNTPADTTTAITYSIKWRTADSATLVWNRTPTDNNDSGYSRSASSIIAMEIGA